MGQRFRPASSMDVRVQFLLHLSAFSREEGAICRDLTEHRQADDPLANIVEMTQVAGEQPRRPFQEMVNIDEDRP